VKNIEYIDLKKLLLWVE